MFTSKIPQTRKTNFPLYYYGFQELVKIFVLQLRPSHIIQKRPKTPTFKKLAAPSTNIISFLEETKK